MFTPAAFAETDLHWLDLLLARDPFVTVLTLGADGLPEATRLPVLYRREGDRIELSGHWARPNPQARHSGAAKVLVNGPHGYVSASWYPDKEAASRVPTWNHAGAELTGQLHTFDDADGLSQLLEQLSDHFEARAGQAWRFERDHAPHQRMLRGIVGFRFQAQRAEITLKFSQNHPESNQLAVIDALDALADADNRELAQWMRRFRRGLAGDD